MPRSKGDHEARRRDVSEAVWRVLTAHGFGGLTMRAVAAELGATTGLLTHYFTGKQELLTHALALLDERTGARSRRTAVEGLASLRAVLLDVLPLTGEAAAGNRIWVSSWDVALADPALSDTYAAKYRASRDRLRGLVAEAQRLGDLRPGDPATIAADALSFTLGLVVQALFDPVAFPARRQIELLDHHLAGLAP
ncbi:TetR family transcriptional regulator C-terminal domain-containing protein [Amycolatopsis sp. NPDC051371]|uniref:TetR/AcrR family transcriptional regulator n=1 Tax=Amycolatopsis sp. NPDC051371 TaxID=3155800 RepID=UPI003413B86E